MIRNSLFHATGVWSAAKILRTRTIQLAAAMNSSEHSLKARRKLFYLSTSRIMSNRYRAIRSKVDCTSNSTGIGSNSAIRQSRLITGMATGANVSAATVANSIISMARRKSESFTPSRPLNCHLNHFWQSICWRPLSISI
jgi:hypothetical protein